jgi:hypothetical protein
MGSLQSLKEARFKLCGEALEDLGGVHKRALYDQVPPQRPRPLVCSRGSRDASRSGRRSADEAIGNIYSPIAWLPPGYEPGVGDGVQEVASAAWQRGLFGLGTF